MSIWCSTISEFVTPAQIEPGLCDRTLTCNGVSKAYAMTGWRIGYAGGPVALIRAMGTIQSQSTSNPSSVSQYAALEALERPAGLPVRLEARLPSPPRPGGVDAELCAGHHLPRPEGAFYVYPDISGCIGKTSAGGAVIADDSFARRRWRKPGWRWCLARPSVFRRTSASATLPRRRCWKRPASASRPSAPGLENNHRGQRIGIRGGAMPDGLPDYYFRIRENGAVVFRSIPRTASAGSSWTRSPPSTSRTATSSRMASAS